MKLRFLFSLMLGGTLAAGAQGYQDGVDNYNADRIDIAKEILNNTLSDPSTDKAVSYYYLGNIEFRNGNIGAAKSNYEKGVQANPDYAYNLIGLGQVALKEGDKGVAQKYFDQALKTDKKNTALMAAVARAYWSADPVGADEPVDYPKDVKKWIDKALKESKNTEPEVYMLQGDMAASVHPGKAAGFYEMAIDQDKAKGNVNREAYVKYAHVYDVHNRPLVIEKLEELNELEPNSGLAQRELAEVYYNNGQYDKAWHSYEKYVKNPNHFRRDEQRYAGLLFAAGKYPEAIVWAKKVLDQEPSNYYMDRIAMQSYFRSNDFENAAPYGDKLFKAPGADYVVHDYIVYGDVLNNVGRSAEAIPMLETAINKYQGDKNVSDDNLGSLYRVLVKAYSNTGDNDKAIEVNNAFLATGKASYEDYYNMYTNLFSKAGSEPAGSEAAKTDYREALKYLDMAIEKMPNHYFYYFQKAYCNYMLNGKAVNQNCVDALDQMFAKLDASSDALKEGAKPYLKSAYAMLMSFYDKSNPTLAKEYKDKMDALGI